MPAPFLPTGRGRLFIVSAPSGAGKTTLCRRLRQRMPTLGYSVSYTTRPPRSGEREGVDYHFIDRPAFEAGIAAGRWAEWARVHDHFYGTSAAALEKALAAGQDVLLDIDVQGARQLKQRFADSVTVFVAPPSLAELERRLRGRKTDSESSIRRRMTNAEAELAAAGDYDHRIVNDRLAPTVERLVRLVGDHRSGSESRK